MYRRISRNARRAPCKNQPRAKSGRGKMRSVSPLEDSARASLLISCLIQAVRCGKYEVNCSCHRKEEQSLGEAMFYLICTPTFDPPSCYHWSPNLGCGVTFIPIRRCAEKSCRQDNLYSQEERQNYSS